MADVVSSGDQALIAAYLATRGARRIAVGVSGLNFDTPLRSFYVAAHANNARRVATRRAKVLVRVQKRQQFAVIAKALGVSVATIAEDVRALKRAGKISVDLRKGDRNG